MNVQVIDVKTGKPKFMTQRYADILVKMKRAKWPEDAEPASVPAPAAPPPTLIKVSKTAQALADSAKLDLSKVKGTGPDGAITKPDVQAAIAAQKSAQE
ncbi:E3 binding domain-containing protein [Pseudomonas resinovorans]|uniref:E3 binding domain-containing protein n=1 Tax=Metapseudomonas resinovorans TaxID=53412 RepID=A0ABT4Y9A6_METRE|nr:E3 binding domain-containing protein [Pseudomonas resinovorans]MDA8485155.1 E3 binding domain-containing protein [Pseudomonas resinovorans]